MLDCFIQCLLFSAEYSNSTFKLGLTIVLDLLKLESDLDAKLVSSKPILTKFKQSVELTSSLDIGDKAEISEIFTLSDDIRTSLSKALL